MKEQVIEFIVQLVIFVIGYNMCFSKQPIKILSKDMALRIIGLFLIILGYTLQNGGV